MTLGAPDSARIVKHVYGSGKVNELFKRSEGMPHSKESLWSAIFGIFLLYIAEEGRGGPRLKVWILAQFVPAPRYRERVAVADLSVVGLRYDDLSIEPTKESMIQYFQGAAGLPPEIAGVEPDIIARLDAGELGTRWIAVENKISGGALQDNQMHNYPRIVETLSAANKAIDVCLLMPKNPNKRLLRQATELQERMKANFGIFLWEDVIRLMCKEGFSLPGIDFRRWLDCASDLEEYLLPLS
ncbi:MAG: hypothetical protein WAN33_01070 [Candidatus Acidiferrales bacterium]